MYGLSKSGLRKKKHLMVNNYLHPLRVKTMILLVRNTMIFQNMLVTEYIISSNCKKRLMPIAPKRNQYHYEKIG